MAYTYVCIALCERLCMLTHTFMVAITYVCANRIPFGVREVRLVKYDGDGCDRHFANFYSCLRKNNER